MKKNLNYGKLSCWLLFLFILNANKGNVNQRKRCGEEHCNSYKKYCFAFDSYSWGLAFSNIPIEINSLIHFSIYETNAHVI